MTDPKPMLAEIERLQVQVRDLREAITSHVKVRTELAHLIQIGVTHRSLLAFLGRTGPQRPNDSQALLEALAVMEHDRWSRWQSYLHSKCIPNADGSLTIPAESVAHWQRQIETSYEALSEREKGSDRKEARNSLELVVAHGWGAPGRRWP